MEQTRKRDKKSLNKQIENHEKYEEAMRHLTCPICFCLFQPDNHKMCSLCGTSFCTPCIQKAFTRYQKCPFCNQLTSLSSFIKNKLLSAMLPLPTPTICLRHHLKALLYCQDCLSPCCKTCLPLHSTHNLTSIETSPKPTLISLYKAPSFPSTHLHSYITTIKTSINQYLDHELQKTTYKSPFPLHDHLLIQEAGSIELYYRRYQLRGTKQWELAIEEFERFLGGDFVKEEETGVVLEKEGRQVWVERWPVLMREGFFRISVGGGEECVYEDFEEVGGVGKKEGICVTEISEGEAEALKKWVKNQHEGRVMIKVRQYQNDKALNLRNKKKEIRSKIHDKTLENLIILN